VRWIEQLYARNHGYFWLPCPRCGRYFGGHEQKGTDLPTPGQPGRSKAACERCVISPEDAAAEQIAAWGYGYLEMPNGSFRVLGSEPA
jgi:hypothetical protein